MPTATEDATASTYSVHPGSVATPSVVPVSGMRVPCKYNVPGDSLVSDRDQSGQYIKFFTDPRGQGPAIPIHSEEFIEIVETAEILADAELSEQIRTGVNQADRGETRSWADVKEEMGL